MRLPVFGWPNCALSSHIARKEYHLTICSHSKLFAPSEDATAKLDKDSLCSQPKALKEMLLYHVVDDVLSSILIAEGPSEVKTVQGSYVSLNYVFLGTIDEELRINDARVISIDISANTGIVHLVDQVLQISAPPSKGEYDYIIERFYRLFSRLDVDPRRTTAGFFVLLLTLLIHSYRQRETSGFV